MNEPREKLQTDAAGLADLLERAREVRSRSYSPYSGFRVGAALLADDGRVFAGTNVENASYGMTTCAEQSAVARAIAEGARSFVAIAVAGPEDDAPCAPCGRCRQVLHEFGEMTVVTPGGAGGAPLETSLSQLLPGAFGPADLSRNQP